MIRFNCNLIKNKIMLNNCYFKIISPLILANMYSVSAVVECPDPGWIVITSGVCPHCFWTSTDRETAVTPDRLLCQNARLLLLSPARIYGSADIELGWSRWLLAGSLGKSGFVR